MRTNRQSVLLDFLALFVQNLYHWYKFLVAAIYDDLVLETGLLIDLNFVGDTLNHISEPNGTTVFGDDDSIVRIPCTKNLCFLHLVAILDKQC